MVFQVWITETVECYANLGGEVIENQLKSEKFNENLTDTGKKDILPTETTKRASVYYYSNEIRRFLTEKTGTKKQNIWW